MQELPTNVYLDARAALRVEQRKLKKDPAVQYVNAQAVGHPTP